MTSFGSSHLLSAYGRLIAAGALLAGCQQADRGDANRNNAAAEPVIELPAPVSPVTPMDRQALLVAIAKAASARATATDDDGEQRELEGRPFEFPIRFGCDGPVEDLRSALLGWSYQSDQKILRLRATPTITADDPVAAAVGGEAAEAIEGFWVPRPWAFKATCPPIETRRLASAETSADPVQRSSEAAPSSSGGPKVGIAQFFTRSDARTRRRDQRAYEAVVTNEPDPSARSLGFDLVLSGRLRARPGKRVIECVASTGDSAPDCIVSADIHEVRMEQPEGRRVMARWGS